MALAQGLGVLKAVDFLERAKEDSWYQSLILRYAIENTDYVEWRYPVPEQLTALHVAACFGLYDVVVKLLEKGYDPNAEDSTLGTALWWAARQGHSTVVELLLESDVDLETKDSIDFQTPLSIAARHGHEVVVKLLLDKGADLESQSGFDLALPPPILEPYKWTMPDEKPFSMRHYVVRNFGYQAPLTWATPLAWAARCGHETVVKLLVAETANFEARDYKGLTPLSWAANGGNTDVVELLLKECVDFEVKDDFGMTPLAHAAEHGNERIMAMLLAKGADLEAKNEHGKTPLGVAVESGSEAAAQLLLTYKANLEAKDSQGMTPLSCVTRDGNGPMVKLLLASGADPEAQDNFGSTPLYHAINNRHFSAARLLLNNGAKSVVQMFPRPDAKVIYPEDDYPNNDHFGGSGEDAPRFFNIVLQEALPKRRLSTDAIDAPPA
ncbi:hypothetical protein ACHAQJ_004950 [Trichoderma viride]